MDEDALPIPVSQLPHRRLSFATFEKLRSADSFPDIWIPRVSSIDDLECDVDDACEAPWGFVPLHDIAEFYLETKNRLLKFEFDDGEWYIVAKLDLDEIGGQMFAAMMKPYVEIRRVKHHRQFER
jgi:hypothetical protein